jgi:hypothetical protein
MIVARALLNSQLGMRVAEDLSFFRQRATDRPFKSIYVSLNNQVNAFIFLINRRRACTRMKTLEDRELNGRFRPTRRTLLADRDNAHHRECRSYVPAHVGYIDTKRE